MTTTLDISDVPPVSTVELAIAVRLLIGGGKPLANAAGATERDLREVESELWRRHSGIAGRKLAVVLRLRALVDALGARRIAKLIGDTGNGAKLALVEAAAGLRLNAERGFAPQHLVWALQPVAQAPASISAPMTVAVEQLAA